MIYIVIWIKIYFDDARAINIYIIGKKEKKKIGYFYNSKSFKYTTNKKLNE